MGIIPFNYPSYTLLVSMLIASYPAKIRFHRDTIDALLNIKGRNIGGTSYLHWRKLQYQQGPERDTNGGLPACPNAKKSVYLVLKFNL